MKKVWIKSTNINKNISNYIQLDKSNYKKQLSDVNNNPILYHVKMQKASLFISVIKNIRIFIIINKKYIWQIILLIIGWLLGILTYYLQLPICK